jgi:DMSO/TMAO reductase YedYZ heme-binding membrane subunit
MNWKQLSTIAAWSAGIIAILYSFSKKYITIHPLIFIIVEAVALLILMVAEIMKMIDKGRLNKGHVDE